MADRYERLMYINDIYYCENAPAILEAHALLKDSKENRIVAQLKFRNISGNVIKAVEIGIAATDSFGKEIEGVNSFQYTDLNVDTNNAWGEKQAITMPNNDVRSIQVAIKSVLFSDGTLWNATGNPIAEKITKPLDLTSVLKDKELIKQFRIEYGTNASNVYMQEKDIWHCVCGCINKLSLECCCACAKKKSEISNYSLELLQKNMRERCAKEKQEQQKKRIEEEHELVIKHEKEKKRKQIIKRRVLLGVCFSMVLILAGGWYYYQNVYLVEYKYLEACKLYEGGQLKDAQDAFKNLTDYKDSDNYIKRIEQEMHEAKVSVSQNSQSNSEESVESRRQKYNQAKELINQKKYEEANEMLSSLDGHKDEFPDLYRVMKRVTISALNEHNTWRDDKGRNQIIISGKKVKVKIHYLSKEGEEKKANYSGEIRHEISTPYKISVAHNDKIDYIRAEDIYNKGVFDGNIYYRVHDAIEEIRLFNEEGLEALKRGELGIND